MSKKDELIFQTFNEYRDSRIGVGHDQALSATGKLARQAEVTSNCLAKFDSIKSGIMDEIETLEAEMEKLQGFKPAAKDPDQAQAAAHQGKQIISSLYLSDDAIDFIEIAREQARKYPDAFLLVFQEAVNTAEAITPAPSGSYDPWNQTGSQQEGKRDHSRARVIAELKSLYREAVEATTTPAEIRNREEAQKVQEDLNGLNSDLILLERMQGKVEPVQNWPVEAVK